jgi:uncharacterized repeat protein (TIGR01451 family)
MRRNGNRAVLVLGAALVAAAMLVPTAGAQQPSADVAVTKTDAPDPVRVGNNVTYTVTVRNNGPDRATGVTLTDVLPAGVTLVSERATRGNCTGTATVTCSFGALGSGQAATVTIVVKTTAAGTVTNTVQVAAEQTDPDTANNTATTETTVRSGVRPCTITGTAGADVLRGTAGRDVICGLGGGDVVYGVGGNDVIRAGGGNDVVYAGGGDDRVRAGGGLDVVYGQGGNDTISGGRGADVLYGQAGADRLLGNGGFDVLNGGFGNDVCRRGLGGAILISC